MRGATQRVNSPVGPTIAGVITALRGGLCQVLSAVRSQPGRVEAHTGHQPLSSWSNVASPWRKVEFPIGPWCGARPGEVQLAAEIRRDRHQIDQAVAARGKYATGPN